MKETYQGCIWKICQELSACSREGPQGFESKTLDEFIIA